MLLSRITILLIMLSSQLFAQPTAQRIKYNFNSDWKVFIGDITGAEVPEFSDESWKHVTVPYSWNEDEAFAKDIATLSTGIAWYRKHFKLPEEDKGKKNLSNSKASARQAIFTLMVNTSVFMKTASPLLASILPNW